MDLCGYTIHELRNLLDKREISSEEIVKAYTRRIDDVDSKVKAYVFLTRDMAIRKAREYDNGQKQAQSDIAGIPFALKDAICTRGVKTTCSSKALGEFIPTYDATVAGKLGAQGGILLGKLNMDELSMGSSTETSTFFSTRNPWDLQRVSGGSSGGSAAAVAADEIPFALGTDTGGSIRQPASFCGVVGLKPTYGRVSRWGVVAFASSLDQVGVLSKDVKDSAIVLRAIAGSDKLDSTTADMKVPDYTGFLNSEISGLKIGYPREYFQSGVEKGVKEVIEKALRKYEELGAIVEEVSLPHSKYSLSAYCIIAAAEASTNLARIDGVRYGIRDFEAANVAQMFANTRAAGFGPEVKRRIILGTYVLSSVHYEDYYIKALKTRRLINDDFTKVFENYDIIVSPTTPTTAFKAGEQNDLLQFYMNDILTASVNLAGLPGISIPCGFLDGLPVGMQIIGKPFAEGKILNAAYAFEQNTDYHVSKPVLGV